VATHFGGAGKTIPFYQEQNNPYAIKEQKPDYKPDYKSDYKPDYKPEQKPEYTQHLPTKDKLVLDLQLYDNKKPAPNPLANKMGFLPVEPVAMVSPYVPPQFQTQLNNYMKNFYTPFIYKDYHINIEGPNADRSRASMIYEDILPPTEIFTSYKTVRERNNLTDYIRSTFITIEEGENKDFSGGSSSLLTRLKLIELTPHNTNYFSNNPYVTSAKDFLIYTSCYPINYDRKEGDVKCHSSAIGMDLRVYKISEIELIAKYPKTAGNFNYKDIKELNEYMKTIQNFNNNLNKYNIWRDLEYYEFIRNEINKKYISPNFVGSYCYFTFDNSNLDFTKNGINNANTNKSITNSTVSLLLLTESPNQNIIDWCSNIYRQERSIHTQIQVGFRTEHVWKSIIAQMLLSFYVMIKYKFTFNKMKFHTHFFIKSISLSGDTKLFWIYKINGIEYYIPSHGQLLLINYYYNDLSDNKQKKILSTKFKNDEEKDINETIIENIKECFNIDGYTKGNYNIIIPDTIQNIFKTLHTSFDTINKDNIETEYLKIANEKFLYEFVNNRIGTLIRDLEFPHIKKNDIRVFKTGEICVYESKYETYEIVLFLKNDNEHECICLSKEDNKNNIIEKRIPKDQLYHYSSTEYIKQDIKTGDSSLTMDSLIETYII